MNTIFRIVWSVSRGQSVVASELAKRRTKSRDGLVRRALLALGLVAGVGALSPVHAYEAGGGDDCNDNNGRIAIGSGATACNQWAIALGNNAETGGESSIAIGRGSYAETGNTGVGTEQGGVALGGLAETYGGVAIGFGAVGGAPGTGNNDLNPATAIGGGTQATALRAIGIGVTDAAPAMATGTASIAIGNDAQASTLGAIAIGRNTQASVDESIALGSGVTASGDTALAFGQGSTASADSTLAFGDAATASGTSSIAFGTDAVASGIESISIGTGNTVSGDGSGAIGDPTTITGSGSYSVGNDNTIDADEAGVFGNRNVLDAAATGSRIIGNDNDVDVPDAFVMGNGADVTVAEGMALGNGSIADTGAGVAGYNPTTGAADGLDAGIAATQSTTGAVAVGDAGAGTYRQITGVAAGTEDSDAVNVAQLKASETHYYSVNDDGVQGGNYANDGATGVNALAGGVDAIASGTGGVAVGNQSQATGPSSLALGDVAQASGPNAIAMGTGAVASAEDSISIGTGNQVSGVGSGAIGDPTTITGAGSYSVGNNNTIDADEAGVFGNDNILQADADGSRIIGNGNDVDVADAFVMGNGSDVTVAEGVALGNGSIADTAGGIQGYNPTTGAADGLDAEIAATQSTTGAVAVGDAGNDVYRQITGVAAGTEDSDAVNVAQLKASETHYYSVNDDGVQGGNYANDGATGVNALAAGVDASAAGDGSIAVGGATAGGTSAISMGTGASVPGNLGVAIGENAQSLGNGSSGWGTVAIGNDSFVDGGSVAGVALGSEASVTGASGVAVGGRTSTSGTNAVAMGYLTDASGDNSVALGSLSSSTVDHGVALGNNSVANTAAGVAGYDPVTDAPSTDTSSTWLSTRGAVSVGGNGETRQITNVAAGTAGTDAVNVAQLQAGQTHYYSVNDDGVQGGNYANDGATGVNAIASGVDAVASGDGTVAMGHGANADQADSVALGTDASSRGISSVALGDGASNDVFGDRQIAIGNDAATFGSDDLAIGSGAQAQGQRNVVLGTTASTGNGILDGIAMGTNASAGADDGVALGSGASASAVDGVALGSGSVADGSTLGSAAYQPLDADGNPIPVAAPTAASEVSVGSAGSERRITNVAAGAEDTDAVNVSQLAAVESVASTGWDLTAQGADPTNVAPGDTVDLSNTDGNLVIAKNTADGSLEEVTFDLSDEVMIGDTTINGDGIDMGGDTITNVGAPVDGGDAVNLDYFNENKAHYYSVNDGGIQGGNYDNDGATGVNAIASGVDATATADGGIAMGYGATAGNVDSVALGTDSVTAAPVGTASTTIAGINYTFAGGTPTGTVSVGDAGNERTLTNVAAGRISASSTDAINGSQLFTTNQAVENASQGWDLTAQGADSTNVAPGDTVDLSNTDGNLVIAKNVADGTQEDVTFDLADDVTVNNSVTVGSVVTDATTNDITGLSNTDLSDPSFATAGRAATEEQLDLVDQNLTNQGLDFAGDSGTDVHRDLGQTLNVVGGADASGNTNISTVANGTDALEIVMTDQPQFGNVTVNTGGGNTINGLSNTTFDPNAFTSGQAATEDQLAQVSDVANTGWDLTAESADPTNVAPGDTVDLSNTDGNLVIAKNAADGPLEEVTFDLSDEVTIGDTTINDDGIDMGGDTITNVGAPVNGGDAVNLDYFNENKAHYYSVNDGGTQGGNYANDGATGVNAIASGVDAMATADGGIAMGYGATAGNVDSVALGTDAVTAAPVGTASTTIAGLNYTFAGGTPTGTVSVGDVGNERTITNVAAGRISASSTDAINGSQLFASNQAIENLNTDLQDSKVRYYSVNDGGTQQDNYANDGAEGVDSLAAGVAASTDAGAERAVSLGYTTSAVGVDSVAIGQYASAETEGAIAIGRDATANGGQSTSIGYGNTATGDGAVAIGDPSTAIGDGAVVMGKDNYAEGTGAVSLGNNNTSEGDGALAIGDTNTSDGNGAITMGVNNQATGNGAVAMGNDNVVTGDGAFAVGNNATSGALDTLALGTQATATQQHAMALGNSSEATGFASFAAGNTAVASGEASMALGQIAEATGLRSSAIGLDALASAEDALGVGTEVEASGLRSTALGNFSVAGGQAALALGSNSQANVEGSVALGARSDVLHEQSVALGAATETVRGAQAGYTGYGKDVTEDSVGEIAIAQVARIDDDGNQLTVPGNRQITGVAAGVEDTDAVNVSQLKGIETHYYSVNDDGTQDGNFDNDGATGVNAIASGVDATATADGGIAMGYGATAGNVDSVALGTDSVTAAPVGTASTTIAGINYTFAGGTPTGTVSVGDAGNERTLTNVAAGRISASSTDAINGSQLFATNQAVENASQGWDLTAQGADSTNVAPGDTVDLSNTDGNLVIAKNAADGPLEEVTFDLSDEVTIGDTTINDDGIDMGGDTITNVGAPVDGGDAVNLDYFDENRAHYYSVNDDGVIGGNYDNDGATGVNALAGGVDALASADGATSLGFGADARILGSVALGSGSISNRALAPASGFIPANGATIEYNTTDKELLGAISVGDDDSYRQITNVADGTQAQDAVTVRQLQGAVGSVIDTGIKYFHANSTQPDSAAVGQDSIAVGPTTVVNGDAGIGMGNGAIVGQMAPGGTAIGDGAEVMLSDGMALGTASLSEAQQGIALGAGATVSHDQSVALGSNSVTAEPVATSGTTIAGTDYDFAGTAPQSTVSVGDVGKERTITNVAAGRVSETSTDAINGSQLYATNQAVETIGAGWTISAEGSNASNVGVDSATGNAMDLSNADGNIVVSKAPDSNDVTFDLSDEVTVGDTMINEDGIDMGGDTITNVGAPVNEGDAVNLEYFNENRSHYYSVNDGGTQGGNYDNDGATGMNAIAAGVDASATADGAVAMGDGATANEADSVALGSDSVTAPVAATTEVVIDGETYVVAGSDPAGSVSVGDVDAERTVTNVAAGRVSETSTDAVNGSQLHAATQSIENLNDEVEAGQVHYYSVNDAGTQGGNYANDGATGVNAIASGVDATATADGAIAMGDGATASETDSVALGSGATTEAAVGTADFTLGGQTYAFAGASPIGTVSVGSAGAERTITNVAAGRISADSTDAINGSQLHATNQAVENVEGRVGDVEGDVNELGDRVTNVEGDVANIGDEVDQLDDQAVKYDTNDDGSVNYDSITLEGDGGTTITNVADGEIAEDSSDAVNGGQLWEVQEQITNIDEGGIKYFKANSEAADARAEGAESVAMGPESVAQGDQSVATGDGAVAESEGGVALGAGSQATREGMDGAEEAFSGESVASTQGAVSVGSDGGERQITHVAGGTAATDAVNVRQLESVQEGAVNYDRNDDGSVDYSSVTMGQEGTPTQIHNVAAGEAPTDAANVGQLEELNQQFNQQIGGLNKRIDDVEDDANAGSASAIAAASVPQAYLPGKSMVSAGAGTYSGESAVAVGVSRLSDNGRWAVKLNATGDSQGNFGAGVGAGFHW
ncbi:YadA-like family protein [Halomonas elongata]|uniref:YadA-like family protein n=1 Tax=Halomonas elongata TaxID=2746 RepID=UPI0023B0F261|nr:YadA-like family protein [Halomonas elongata]